MTRRSVWMAGLAALAAFALVLPGEAQPRQRVSPHETATGTIGGQTLSISYGRPSVKGRQVLGNLIPFGKVWRLGADEATKLTTPVDIEINGLKVPAGEYSMFFLVTEDDGATLIINKVANQWGAFKYDASQDVGRVPVDGDQGYPHTEQLTIGIESTGDKSGRISFAWGDGKAYATVRVP
jgi:hypothetical protein